jgi:transglutaminase-like putative cysteine protease
MTARLRIQYRSQYRYADPIRASFNELRLTPLSTAWQSSLEFVLRVEEATWQTSYSDYWGTQVRVFEAHNPHGELSIQATSLVEVDGSRLPAVHVETPWEAIRAASVVDTCAEFLAQTASTRPDEELADLVAQIAATTTTPYDAARKISGAIHDAMSYLPGSTGVHTLAQEAWESRAGVCQDYAHVYVGALRHVGIPARYVSGYLHPKTEPVIGETATGESHAWVELWLGDWAGHDPTNDAPVGERHVLVGRGRDYSDVPPIKGIVAGSAKSALTVSVEVTRLA